MSTFKFGTRSLEELNGVHEGVVECCHYAIKRSSVDFGVHDGLRTIEQQREYVRTGASQTLNSKHLVQPDGFGHAVDLVPYINGKLRWEEGPCLEVACAMVEASAHCRVELVWGGVWDRQADELGMIERGSLTVDSDLLRRAIADYRARRKAMGKKAFIDMPHFELFW